MADDKGSGPIWQCCHLRPEQSSAAYDRLCGLLHRWPPDLVNAREVVFRPNLLQLGPGGAHIAGKCIALTHDRVDGHLQAKRPGDWDDGLQRTGVRRDNDPCDSFAGELPGSLRRLGMTKFCQMRIDDARISPCRTKMEIKFALTVAQEDHWLANTGQYAGPQPHRPVGNICVLGHTRLSVTSEESYDGC